MKSIQILDSINILARLSASRVDHFEIRLIVTVMYSEDLNTIQVQFLNECNMSGCPNGLVQWSGLWVICVFSVCFLGNVSKTVHFTT